MRHARGNGITQQDIFIMYGLLVSNGFFMHSNQRNQQ